MLLDIGDTSAHHPPDPSVLLASLRSNRNQGVFPAYSDNTEVNGVDLCSKLGILATADDAKTVRLLRYPVLRGGAKARSYRAHSSHVTSARFTVGVNPVRLITVGG